MVISLLALLTDHRILEVSISKQALFFGISSLLVWPYSVAWRCLFLKSLFHPSAGGYLCLSEIWTFCWTQNSTTRSMALVCRAHAVNTHVLRSVWRLTHRDCDSVRICFVVQGAPVQEFAITYLRLDKFLFEFSPLGELIFVIARVDTLCWTMALE